MPRGCSEKLLEHFPTVRDWRKSEDNGRHGSIPLAVVPNPQIGAPLICRLELLYFAPRRLIGQQTPQLPKERARRLLGPEIVSFPKIIRGVVSKCRRKERELVMMRTHSSTLEGEALLIPLECTTGNVEASGEQGRSRGLLRRCTTNPVFTGLSQSCRALVWSLTAQSGTRGP